MKGWKIVNWFEGKYVSYTSFTSSVKYDVDMKATRPKGCGPLAVFTSLESAKKFLKNDNLHPWNAFIFPCHYKKSSATRLWYVDKWTGEKNYAIRLLPEGSDTADYVVLEPGFVQLPMKRRR